MQGVNTCGEKVYYTVLQVPSKNPRLIEYFETIVPTPHESYKALAYVVGASIGDIMRLAVVWKDSKTVNM